MFPVSAAWCRTHFFTAEQCQETCYGLWADSLISGRWRFPNWQFFGSEPISDGIRTAWSRCRLDEIISCVIITQLISHFLSVASLPYATFVLAINVIGAELEYLTGHCDSSDIPCLGAFIRAACRSSSWQHGRMKSKKLPPQKPYASLRSAFGLPKNDPWFISRCIWFGRIWRGSRGKACVTDPITLGIIRFGAFEQKMHTIDNSIKCKSVSKNVEIPTFYYSFQNREE